MTNETQIKIALIGAVAVVLGAMITVAPTLLKNDETSGEKASTTQTREASGASKNQITTYGDNSSVDIEVNEDNDTTQGDNSPIIKGNSGEIKIEVH